MVLISVIMCVYNREKYLPEAIESILNQTFRDFEFIIVNDGTTDRSKEILDAFEKKDLRIKVIDNPENLGIGKSISKGLEYCKGEYILIMDSDDISLPERFQRQFDYMESHLEIDVLGTGFNFINENGNDTGKYLIRPADPYVIRLEMFYRCMLHNPTIIARSSFYKNYNEQKTEQLRIGSEDYAFWMRMNFDHLYSNLEDRLLLYRLHDKQLSNTAFFQQRQNILVSAHLAFEKLLGKPIREEVIQSFYFSERLTVTDGKIVRQGLHIMFQAQLAFERQNPLTKRQVKETRTFSYEKIKSYSIKYKSLRGVFLIGMVYLIRLLPKKFISDLLGKLQKKKGKQKLDENDI